MKRKLVEETFYFSDEAKKQIKKSYLEFIEESMKIAKEDKISEDTRQKVISHFIEKMIIQALIKKEKEQNIVFSEDDKKYFREKILKKIGMP